MLGLASQDKEAVVKSALFAGVYLLLLALGLGCSSEPGDEKGKGAEPAASPGREGIPGFPQNLTLAQLKNATYRGLEGVDGPVALVEGRWEGKPARPGAASRPAVQFIRDFRLLGDVDGDGEDEAVVLLGASGGGTGEFIHLALVKRQGAEVLNVATVRLGDRVQLRAGRFEGKRIVLDLVQAGAEDAMCCPGDVVTRRWEWTAAGMHEIPSTVPPARLSPETLAGLEWVLRQWAWNEAAAAEPEVTLVYRDGKINGRSGCNRYFAAVTAGEQPGDLRIGAAAGTRMACPEPATSVESRFLAQLQGVRKFGFMAGQLVLTYEKDGNTAAMLFDPRTSLPGHRSSP